jgi:hypothetical protein
MGAYILKVSPKAVGTLDGVPVYPTKFAYKPYAFGWRPMADTDTLNARMAFQSGAASCIRAWQDKEYSERRDVLVLRGAEVYPVALCSGTLSDERLDCAPVARVDAVTITDRAQAKRWGVKL